MSKRVEPVRKSVRDSYSDLLAGHREAALFGPESALKYLDRTLTAQHSLPNAVKCFAYDRVAEAAAQLGLWQRCAEAVAAGLEYLQAAHDDLGAELRRAKPTMALWERGITARMELGDAAGALALCEDAIARHLGAHFAAKRDSLNWAR
jgi:hypothetical protein